MICAHKYLESVFWMKRVARISALVQTPAASPNRLSTRMAYLVNPEVLADVDNPGAQSSSST